jgi:hypothetical protein
MRLVWRWIPSLPLLFLPWLLPRLPPSLLRPLEAATPLLKEEMPLLVAVVLPLEALRPPRRRLPRPAPLNQPRPSSLHRCLLPSSLSSVLSCHSLENKHHEQYPGGGAALSIERNHFSSKGSEILKFSLSTYFLTPDVNLS